MINTSEIKKGVGGIGNKKNFFYIYLYMKIIISESRLNNTIMNYLDKNYTPNDGWSNDGWLNKEDYSNKIEKFNDYDFYIDDEPYYTYSNFNGLVNNELYVRDNLIEQLSDLFGDYWIPVFKEWFEKNTGLKVKTMTDGQFNNLI